MKANAQVDGRPTIWGAMYFPEAFLIMSVALLGGADMGLSLINEQSVAWDDFLPAFGASAFAAAVGIYARLKSVMERVALFMFGIAIYTGFTAAIAIFVNLQFPLNRPPVDAELASLDLRLGYAWPDLVSWLTNYPSLSRVLAWIYLSSLMQLTLVLALLCYLNDRARLHRFLLVGVLCALGTVLIWIFMPSFGPSTLYALPPGMADSAHLVVDPTYGAELLRLAAEGSPVVTAMSIKGVVAFPSFHTVMACLAVWFTARTPFFSVALVLNLAMLPAILSHGAHHLVDVVGGVGLFGLAMMVTSARMTANVATAADNA